MSIKYKGDIMGRLKEKGYSTARLRKEKIFGERTMQDFRTNAEIPYKSINRLCTLLDCQPGEILEYVPDDANSEELSVCGGIVPDVFPPMSKSE